MVIHLCNSTSYYSFLKIMRIATLTIITFNLDISKCLEGEKIITVSGILKQDEPIFPTFRFITVDACQLVVARQKTTSLHILSIIAVLSKATTMSQFPLYGMTIFPGFDYYVFTHYFLNKNVESGAVYQLIISVEYVYIFNFVEPGFWLMDLVEKLCVLLFFSPSHPDMARYLQSPPQKRMQPQHGLFLEQQFSHKRCAAGSSGITEFGQQNSLIIFLLTSWQPVLFWDRMNSLSNTSNMKERIPSFVD